MIPQINTILYPTDLSDTSNHAFGYAASLANRYDASIVILHVLKAVTHSDVDLVTNVIGEKKWKEVLDRKKMEVVENIRKRLEDFCEQTRTEMSGCPFLVKNINVEIGNRRGIAARKLGRRYGYRQRIKTGGAPLQKACFAGTDA